MSRYSWRRECGGVLHYIWWVLYDVVGFTICVLRCYTMCGVTSHYINVLWIVILCDGAMHYVWWVGGVCFAVFTMCGEVSHCVWCDVTLTVCL